MYLFVLLWKLKHVSSHIIALKGLFLNFTICVVGVLVKKYKKWLKTLYIIASSILYLDIFAVLLHIVNVLYLSLVLF